MSREADQVRGMSGIEGMASGARGRLTKEQVAIGKAVALVHKLPGRSGVVWLPLLTRLAESVGGGARSVGESLEKQSGFGDLLLNEECAPAVNDFAEHDLQDH